MDNINQRKLEHIHILCNDANADRSKFYFKGIQLKHRALPELAMDEVDASVPFMGKSLSFPLIISSMTGGDSELVRQVNKNLAIAAEATGIGLAVGSQRVMFTDPKAKESFELRKYAPNTLLFSNLGAVQLNYGFSINHCREAISAVEADGLYFHLNALQEVVQPEGNTNFSGLAQKIGAVAKQLDKPIILKEIGAGVSPDDVALAIQQGIKYIDVAGSGGVSWSRIEHQRHRDKNNDLGLMFEDWGIPTPLALQLLEPFKEQVDLIASGGIRSGIDMVKAIILGASLCSMASPFLKPAMESADKVIESILRIKSQFRTAQFLLGISKVKDLKGNPSLLLSLKE